MIQYFNEGQNMAQNYTNVLKELFRGDHENLKQMLRNLGVAPEYYYFSNCSKLSRELIRRRYHGAMTRQALNIFVDNILNPPAPPPAPRPPERYIDSEEYRRREQQREDDEMFRRLREDNERLQRENQELKDSNKRQREELITARHDINDIMNIPASETPTTIPHQERLNKKYKNLGGHLDGDIDYSMDKDVTDFIKKHKFKISEASDKCILLFRPEDNELFEQALYRASRHGKGYHRTKYTRNETSMEKENLDKLYYINRITNVSFIRDYLDQIYEQQNGDPFKISCDAGFIQQTYDDDRVSYDVTHVMAFNTGKSCPVVISNRKDLNTYKHYVYSYISEKMEQTHENSRNQYIAIHSFLFKVFPTAQTGKGKSKLNVAPGYEWVLNCPEVCSISCDYNLCAFVAALHVMKPTQSEDSDD